MRTGKQNIQYVCQWTSVNGLYQHFLCITKLLFPTSLSSRQEKTHTYSVIVSRSHPPLKGTGFRTERKRVCVRESEVDRQRGPGEARAHGETLPSNSQPHILRDRPEEINLPPFHGDTKVKHAPRNPRVKPYPQGGQGTQPYTPILRDTDNCPPVPFTKRHWHMGPGSQRQHLVAQLDGDNLRKEQSKEVE